MDAGDARAAVVRTIFQQRDQSAHPGDLAFFERLLRLVGSDSLDLPVFPQVAAQLDQLLRAGDPPTGAVTNLVRQEPDLVRQVLLQANAATYVRGVTGLDHAIARVGLDAVWRIALRACFNAPIFRVPRFEGPLNALRVRGVATGEVAGWLADQPRGDPYLAGLLHGVGGLLVFRAAVEPRRTPPPLRHTVLAFVRHLEPELGVLVADTWRLSDTVRAAVACRANPEAAPRFGRRCARILRVARLAVLQAEAGDDASDEADSTRRQFNALAHSDDIFFEPQRTLQMAQSALVRASQSTS